MKPVIFLLALCVQQLYAQINTQQKLKIDTLLQQFVETKQFSGTVLLAKNNDILYSKSVGLANKETAVPNKLETNFNIASMGKTFTATLIMQLMQEGKLSVNEKVATILPEFTIKRADSITVYQLLTHTSGVGNYMMHVNFEDERRNLKSLDDVMPYVVAMEPTSKFPGESYQYSNSGFIILGKIIEKLTGKSYNENLEERIFTKTGMKQSYIHYPATFDAPKEATPYLAYTPKTFVNGTADEFPGFSDGGMQSNVVDLYRFAKGLLNGKLLSTAMRDSMWNGKVKFSRGGMYSFGWMDNENSFGKHIYSHDGGGKGFSSDLRIVKEDGYVIVVLINNRVNPRDVSDNILRILYNKEVQQPIKFLENILLEITEAKGFDYVYNNYKQILKEQGMDKTPNPWVYIMFSDMFENLKDMEKALKVMEMGRAEFPNEASMYNVTGQLYANQKKYKEAAEWFNKALAINANDEFAKMMLNNISSKLK
jgi:CubicO group peptidase (beta-lactamase class C family)